MEFRRIQERIIRVRDAVTSVSDGRAATELAERVTDTTGIPCGTISQLGILMVMRWTVHSEKPLYTDEWLDIRMADVELPDGRHLEHRLIRTPPGAGCVVVRDGQALLLWRHRFITGSQGWEIPIGRSSPARIPRKLRPGNRGRDRLAAGAAAVPVLRRAQPRHI